MKLIQLPLSLILSTLLLLTVSVLGVSTLSAQEGLPAGAVIFDFNTNNGVPLERGEIVSSVTVDGLTMAVDVESNGLNDAAMIFDTSNPGPDPDLGTPNEACPGGGPGVGEGGEPGTIGENCDALGNVLIIPLDVGTGDEPNDDNAGGIVTLTFDQPVRVVEIHILDIDEPGVAPLITFWDSDGNSTLEAIRPQVVGDNGHEEFTNFPLDAAASVATIQVTFPGSGALDSIIVAPASPVGDIDIVKFVNGSDANDPAGDDVPRFAPGESVAWSYRVTNIGQISYAQADVVVTDSDPTVDPLFDREVAGNGDAVLDPGEVWAYLAVKDALNLQNLAGNPSIQIDICPGDNASLPMENGYMNIGTVTVPDAEASDPAHYCGKEPGIAIRKFINGNDANNPLGIDVPRLAPGDSVMWTYHVTNIGGISYANEDVVVTDSDAAVEPLFSRVIMGNDDDRLDPDEIWEYSAQSQALDLLDAGANPSVEANLCRPEGATTEADQMGYRNVGTVTVPDAEASDPAHYCGKDPGLLIRKYVNGNDANDPVGSDVPRLIPGELITWTYRVTNTGQIPYTMDAIVVTDNDPDVTPTFDRVLVGNDDDQLDPGEVWQYDASRVALDLRDMDDSPLIIPNGCPAVSNEQDDQNAYRNVGSVVAPGTGHEDVATYCNIFPDLDAARTELFDLTYRVTNDGVVAVEEVQVLAGPNVTVTCPAEILAAGDSMVCPAVASDIGFRNSIGWVIAQPIGGGLPIIRAVAPDSDASVSVAVEVNGAAADMPSGPTVNLGAAQGRADLAITVTNSGSAALESLLVAVADQNLSCPVDSLLPDESTICTLTVNVAPGPQVLLGGISTQPAGASEALLQEVRVYMIGDSGS